jgi:hypothetical protein
MGFSRINALQQALDIAGSFVQSQNLNVADEVAGYGAAISGQTGSSSSISSFGSGIATITGLTSMTVQSVGRFLTLSGASNSGNNGTFLIIEYNSASSVNISNPSGVAPDSNNGSIVWTERNPYSLEDDINYIRSDRKQIKGTTNWYDAIPTYQRPTAIGINVPANLGNMAGKTTDAVAYVVNRAFFGQNVSVGNTLTTISSTGNLKHADSVNRIGVPVFDVAPFNGDYSSCYVHIVDGYSSIYGGSELTVLSGPHAGERIFGLTYNGSSASPNSVEIRFFSAPFNTDYHTSASAYTWESGQPSIINVIYGYNERLDQLDANALRSIPSLGILTDASVSGKINYIYSQLGTADGYTNLSSYLSNTTSFYPFFNLPNATPTVVDALNTLNSQIGNRNYTGAVLTDGQTITASLQALANAIGGSSMIRIIERLAADVNANTEHTLPGGNSYTLDGTGNGRYLWIFTRGILRDPGLVSAGNDYMETTTTSVTFYALQRKDDHINYFIAG